MGKDVDIEFLDSDIRALIALQGPKSITALEDITSFSFANLYFMQTQIANVAGVDDCRITRCGYTGVSNDDDDILVYLFDSLYLFPLNE